MDRSCLRSSLPLAPDKLFQKQLIIGWLLKILWLFETVFQSISSHLSERERKRENLEIKTENI